jgi:hypothetical protein
LVKNNINDFLSSLLKFGSSIKNSPNAIEF